jgi:hypothetical protein
MSESSREYPGGAGISQWDVNIDDAKRGGNCYGLHGGVAT